MDSDHRRGGIEVITGPMFAGKSEELMRRVRRATIAGQQVVVVHHALDDRRGVGAVSSHAGGRIPAHAVAGAADLQRLVTGQPESEPAPATARSDVTLETTAVDLVAVDEAQFFGEDVVPVVVDLADRGVTVVVSGLCLTFDDQPFEPVPSLMACAESVTKLLAVCAVCGADAPFHRRTSAGVGNALASSRDHVGGGDLYQARCRRHR
ncbi:thymidine kinase [Citricoccus sp. GCM10030269]|uniref:thymidine kinase n=1 Tax=Citricoccus sp. GCM10030269 TaxID=3273388 RepID=UPI00360D8836